MFKHSVLLCLLFSFSLIVHSADSEHPIAVCHEFTSEESAEPVKIPELTFAKGVLWKIEKDKQVNYLFGTMHSQDYAVSKFPPQVRLALVKSRTLLMETIPNEEANQTFIDMMFFKDGQQLNTLLEPVLFTELKQRIEPYGVEAEQVSNLKPWAAFSLIGRPKPVRAPTLESNLLQTAQQYGLEIKSLESMREILSELDVLAMEDQLIILKDTICNHDKIIRNTKTLVDLYVARDLQGIVEFNQQPHHDEAVFERFIERILHQRNIRMLERIEKEFINGNVFVAVGASHLAEEKGLLNQLEQKGYTVNVIY